MHIRQRLNSAAPRPVFAAAGGSAWPPGESAGRAGGRLSRRLGVPPPAGVKKKAANFVMNGYWSLKAEKEHQLVGVDVHRCNTDPTGLYLDVPDAKDWDFDRECDYVHYTEARLPSGAEPLAQPCRAPSAGPSLSGVRTRARGAGGHAPGLRVPRLPVRRGARRHEGRVRRLGLARQPLRRHLQAPSAPRARARLRCLLACSRVEHVSLFIASTRRCSRRYDVVYCAAHKNFSTSGVCYLIAKRELINEDVRPARAEPAEPARAACCSGGRRVARLAAGAAGHVLDDELERLPDEPEQDLQRARHLDHLARPARHRVDDREGCAPATRPPLLHHRFSAITLPAGAP